jgi:hypothetical protein
VVETAELFSDGQVTLEELARARTAAAERREDLRISEWHAEAQDNFRDSEKYGVVAAELAAAEAALGTGEPNLRAIVNEIPVAAAEAERWDFNDFDRELEEIAYKAALDADDDYRRTPMEAACRARALARGELRRVRVKEECRAQSDLLREVFGNPFRPVMIDNSLRGITLTHIAAGIYTDCAFDRLPILADALEEAGCTDAEILSHCRQPGEHVRGCWVVDLILGKE